MKKNGFTLAELLVALSIVGIGAALMAPAMSNLIPDKNKLKILRYSANVTNATSNLLDDETIYYGLPDTNGEPDCSGLECVRKPVNPTYNSDTYKGDNKYPNLMSTVLGLDGGSLPDGSKWTFKSLAGGSYQITIDVNGTSNGHNCSFSSKCKKPDTFILNIDKYGAVQPADPLLEAYMKNPLDMNNKKEDLAEARKSSLYN